MNAEVIPLDLQPFCREQDNAGIYRFEIGQLDDCRVHDGATRMIHSSTIALTLLAKTNSMVESDWQARYMI